MFCHSSLLHWFDFLFIFCNFVLVLYWFFSRVKCCFMFNCVKYASVLSDRVGLQRQASSDAKDSGAIASKELGLLIIVLCFWV